MIGVSGRADATMSGRTDEQTKAGEDETTILAIMTEGEREVLIHVVATVRTMIAHHGMVEEDQRL